MSLIFDRMESEVRSYCRSFPAVFETARGPFLYDREGVEYIDFFAGAGTLNYGHNNPVIKQAVVEYLQADGITHSLDLWTAAKEAFLEVLEEAILVPRNLDYRVQFTGPTGTNAVEAALKLARKVKNRSNVVAFTGAYHGLTAGALALTGSRHYRTEAFVNRLNAAFLPYDGYYGRDVDTVAMFRRQLEDNSSGLDMPAAVIVETVQAEGGVNVASDEWLRALAELCREFDILLIVDDIQVGNGRTGKFFSFEHAGIRPDLVILSKAISGLGLPMSLVLISPEIDQWKPAEHTGTFRGNNLAFVAAAEALRTYWLDDAFVREIARKGELLNGLLSEISRKYPQLSPRVRGRGMVWGLEISAPGLAKAVSAEAFKHNLIIELAGSDDQVLKFLPPLVTDEEVLRRGVDILDEALAHVADSRPVTAC